MSAIVNHIEEVTLVILGRVFTDFISGDVITLEPVNDYGSLIIGTNRSTNIQRRTDFDVFDIRFNLQKRSDDDIYLNNLLRAPRIRILNGSYTVNFDKNGNVAVDTWKFESGIFTRRPTHIENDLEGNASSEYTIRFRTSERNI